MPREQKKILLLILDGVGDRPVGNVRFEMSIEERTTHEDVITRMGERKTPLQVAKHPNMDALAKDGSCGIVDMIAPGIPPGSDTSHLALLGYDPYLVYTGRGPFEAIGLGMEVRAGDIAFRCNFATVDANMIIKDRRAGRIDSGTDALAEALSGMVIDGVEFYIKPGVEHRCALIMRGDGLSPEVTDVDPHVTGATILESHPRNSKAGRTADLLNQFTKRSHRALSEHKINAYRRENNLPEANVVLARGAGVVPHFPSFKERTGMKGLCIAGIPIIKGICRLAGLDAPDIPGATGNRGTDIDAKFDAFVKNRENYDFFLINIKGTDICGHDGDYDGKVKFIEKVDESLGKFSSALSGAIVAITGDHSTPISVRDHSGDPLPLCISGEGVRMDDIAQFDEISCARGSLGRIRGKDIIPILMDLANRSEKYGA